MQWSLIRRLTYGANQSSVLLRMLTDVLHVRKWNIYTCKASGWIRRLNLSLKKMLIGEKSLNSINVAVRLRTATLKCLLSVTYAILVALSALTKLGGRIRSTLLKIILTLVFFMLLTPVAWQRRRSADSRISTWKDNEPTGWHSHEQSTFDMNVFGHDELEALTHKQEIDHITLFFYNVLRPFKSLARPPEEKELSADLYVMF